MQTNPIKDSFIINIGVIKILDISAVLNRLKDRLSVIASKELTIGVNGYNRKIVKRRIASILFLRYNTIIPIRDDKKISRRLVLRRKDRFTSKQSECYLNFQTIPSSTRTSPLRDTPPCNTLNRQPPFRHYLNLPGTFWSQNRIHDTITLIELIKKPSPSTGITLSTVRQDKIQDRIRNYRVRTNRALTRMEKATR